jgi:histidinol-phosphate/aromatic aminotransferase/cobyric acid decarboxylase-like protein
MLNRYTEEYVRAEREKDSGFYKVDPDGVTLLYGRFYVLNANYELWRDEKDTYTYPVDGWSWYESEAEARTALNCPVPPTEEEIRAAKLADLAKLKEELGIADGN